MDTLRLETDSWKELSVDHKIVVPAEFQAWVEAVIVASEVNDNGTDAAKQEAEAVPNQRHDAF